MSSFVVVNAKCQKDKKEILKPLKHIIHRDSDSNSLTSHQKLWKP